MKELLQNLVKLQTLEFSESEDDVTLKTIEELRTKIPAQILGHYDRLRARGKKGLAAIRNQVCTGCHMTIPIGTVTTVMHGDDIQLCDTCGRYLYIPDEDEAKPAEQPTPKKPAKKPRKRKTTEQAV